MRVILVAGALANKYRNGGETWVRMSWVVGLQRLGFDVYFVEQITPQACVDATGAASTFEDSVNLTWFRSVTEWFGMTDRSALIDVGGEQCEGMTWSQLLTITESAELLVNISGHLTLAPLFDRIRRKAYIDIDPGFTQFWHADPNTPFHVSEHDFYFTIGENIGSHDCPIPASGLHWRPTRQPVVLEQWPVMKPESVACPHRERSERALLTENATFGVSRLPGEGFTTVASWRGVFGPVQSGGKTYGLKVHEFRKFLELPRRVHATFEIALDIHSADQKDRDALIQHGWRLVSPQAAAGDPEAFRCYVQNSGAEFSVAQGIYVETNSGWFSDRSLRYLASGKPVLVQDTGLGRHISTGNGLVTFRTLDEAVRGANAIVAEYAEHCQAAREIAERSFDSDLVLERMLQEVGVAP